MKRALLACALPLLTFCVAPAHAEVKTREKSAVKFEGMLGRMAGLFGGRGAREGVVSTTVVKGDRKVTMTDATGRIVDLAEEKIYDLDLRRKTYEVTTFAELRERMRKAQEDAARSASKDEGRRQEPDTPEREVEVDFDVKETGQTRQITGHDARQVIFTITVREKGRALEEGGGLVMTADSWLGPRIPAMKEVGDFEVRYWQKLQGGDAAGMSPEQMAAVMAMYPMVVKAMERMQKESVNLEGTPLATTTTFEAVKSKEQLASDAPAGGGGGLGGMLARRVMKKDESKARATIFTIQHEVQEVSTSVAASDLELPAGFTEKR